MRILGKNQVADFNASLKIPIDPPQKKDVLGTVSERLESCSDDSSDVPFNLKMTLGNSLELLPYANRTNLELSLSKNTIASTMGKQGSVDNINYLSNSLYYE